MLPLSKSTCSPRELALAASLDDGMYLPSSPGPHFQEHVDGLLRCYSEGRDCTAFLANLPPQAPAMNDLNAAALLWRLRRGVESVLMSTANCVAATTVEVEYWNSAFYPLAVLAGAMGKSSVVPAIFFLDNALAAVNSLLHKDLRLELAGVQHRTRYWVAASGEPGTGKTPSLELVLQCLREVLEEAPHLAPGSREDRFHMAEQATHAALCHRLVATDGYLFLSSSEAGSVLPESWPANGKWDRLRHASSAQYRPGRPGAPGNDAGPEAQSR